MTMQKQVYRIFCKCINKQITDIAYLNKHSDPLLWDSKLSSGASCFHWSSLRCFYKNTVASIIPKWKNFGTTKTRPPSQTQPSWAIREEGPWSGRWPRTRWPLWQSSKVPLWRWENLPEGQPSLQHSINQDFMVEWPDGSHSSVKGTWQRVWSLPKGT